MNANTGIVDTHVHLWDPAHLRYPWLDTVPSLNRRFDVGDLRAAIGNLPIERFVFVQCECDPAQAIDEAEWVSGLARQEPRIQGIVAYAPIELGEGARQTIAALARNPLVKGVRRMLNSQGLCTTKEFVRGLEILAEHGLAFDLGTVPQVLPEIVDLVKRCLGVRFMLDHLAKPRIKEKGFAAWQEPFALLAQSPNVFCKLSGLATEADRERWTHDELIPYLDEARRCFGPERLCWGGDWPVVTLAATYQRWFRAFSAWSIPDTERRRIMHDNAISFYHLPAESSRAKGSE